MRYFGLPAAALGVLLVSSAGSVQAGSVVFKIPTTLSYTINPPRQPPEQFYNASILAAGANGDIYLLDNDNHRVQHYSADGIYLGQFGEFGDRDGQLVNTTSLAVDPDGTVYVGDQYSFTDGKPAARLQMFDPSGQFIGRSMSLLTGHFGPDHTLYRVT